MEIAIISGYSPGPTGAGQLLASWKEAAACEKIEVKWVHPENLPTVRSLLALGKYLQVPKLLFERKRSELWIKREMMRLALEGDRTVIVLHPQTLGFASFLKMAQQRKETWLYLLDSGFFCRSSYNYIPGEADACVRCVGSNSEEGARLKCKIAPQKKGFKEEQYAALRRLVASGKVKLMAQTESQADLAKQHFGRNVPIYIVGCSMAVDARACLRASQPVERFDFVYHASAVEAKGLRLGLMLAQRMNEFRFLFPFNLWDIGDKDLRRTASHLRNAIFRQMSWSDELALHVSSCNIVLCLSLWSAPIEGALVKSLCLNGKVAVVSASYAFANSLPIGSVITLGSEDIPGSIAILRGFFARSGALSKLEHEGKALGRILAKNGEGVFAKVMRTVGAR